MVRSIDRQKLRMPPDIVTRHKHWKGFREFHIANPDVLNLILTEIDKAVAVGLNLVSIKTIIGKIRWDMTVSTVSHDGFKINDAYTSLYATMIARNWPEYADMFEQRDKRAYK